MPSTKSALIYPYDGNNFDPPAPVFKICLTTPLSLKQTIESQAQLDSGADITVIPKTIAQQLQLMSVEKIQILDYDDVPRDALIYSVRIIVGGLMDMIIRVATSNGEYVLIGRDILNKWSLSLIGPKNIFEIT